MDSINEKLERAAHRFRKAVIEAILPVKTTRVINDVKFRELHEAAIDVTRLLKGQEFVSKSLLADFYNAYGMLRGEIPYFGNDGAKLEDMADKLEMSFFYILEDDRHEDRIPGVPRIS
jgi:hypothetical protein